MQIIQSAQPFYNNLRFNSLDEVLKELDKIENGSTIELSKGWTLEHILDHCQRSLYYTMYGFPVMKPKLFQNTIGKIAFHIFNNRGYMNHDKEAELPGCSWEEETVKVEEKIKLLRQTILDFQKFDGKLFPHFTFGPLSKLQLDKVNSMHIADHLSSISII